ncbi:RDD family protein [Streptomyces sp. W16]|uniref:RDD family protein n=1 Tax=Streptomyces sp. W16 TaxID=3076631 RepID=UPI00295BE65B|nr:RDD family protein [Streptomyces sp. W16]MDV9176752.1 RDD family protein [Streptomyces sp. W16]
MSELVTGEAVALELRPARLPSRALAVLLDLIVAMAAYIGVSVALMFSTASLDDAAQIALSIAAFVLVLVGAPIAVETLSHGRSLGKLAFGLRVVRDDGGPIRFRHALVRGAIGVIEILMTFGTVACIASLVSARGRRLGDVFAGTLVVRERVPAGQTSFVPPPPPWLTGRFAELDLSAVPDGLWLAIRQYLTRMQQLDPQVGWAMAERLATDLVARTGAPAPQGVPPAAYLAAVVQERQARDVRRALGNGGAGAYSPSQAFGGAPAGRFRPGTGVPGVFGNAALQPSSAPQQPSAPPQPFGSAPAPAPVSWSAPAAPSSPAAGGMGADPVSSAPGPRPPTPQKESPADPQPSTGFAPPA